MNQTGLQAADRSDTIIKVTPEVMKQRQQNALQLKKEALGAKLQRVQGAKFEDPAAKEEAIARCKAGIDELTQAISAAPTEEKAA